MANTFVSHYETRPYLTLLYAAACLIVTIPTLFWPELNTIFGGLAKQTHPWLLFTAAFQHGFVGVPAVIHLIGTFILLFILGPAIERLLGYWRFGVLLLSTILLYALLLRFTTLEANGASGVIWAFGPPIFIALREARRLHGSSVRNNPKYQLLGNVLIIMYVVITIVMTAVPYTHGYRGNLFFGFLLGNFFHFAATLLGVGFAIIFRVQIRRKLLKVSLAPALPLAGPGGADLISIGVGIALDTLLLTVLLLALF